MLQLIEKKFLTEDSTDTQLTKDIKKRVKENLSTHYSRYGDEIKTILKTATLLDPRFKAKYLNDMEVEDMKEYLRENACDSEESDCQSSSHSAESPPPAKKKSLGTLFKDNEEERDAMPKEQCIDNELQKYLSSPKLDFPEILDRDST